MSEGPASLLRDPEPSRPPAFPYPGAPLAGFAVAVPVLAVAGARAGRDRGARHALLHTARGRVPLPGYRRAVGLGQRAGVRDRDPREADVPPAGLRGGVEPRLGATVAPPRALRGGRCPRRRGRARMDARPERGDLRGRRPLYGDA